MTERVGIGLLDTSVVIDLPQIDPVALPVRPRISTITLAELGLGVHTAPNAPERVRRFERLQEAEAAFDPIDFTPEAARRFAHLAGLLLDSGRSPRPRTLDLMIGAVASVHGIPLYTRNADDLKGTESLLTTIAV